MLIIQVSIFGQEAVPARYFVPTVTGNDGITYPREFSRDTIEVRSEKSTVFRQGTYEVHLLQGKCVLKQGADSFSADKMAIWAGDVYLDADRCAVRNVLVYLAENVRLEFVTRLTTSRMEGDSWGGRLETEDGIQFSHDEPEIRCEAPDSSEFYQTAFARTFRPVAVVPTQSTDSAGLLVPAGTLHQEGDNVQVLDTRQSTVIRPGDVSALDPNMPSVERARLGVYQRGDSPMKFHVEEKRDPNGKNIAVFDGGINIILTGTPQTLARLKVPEEILQQDPTFGTVDIQADRLVIWSSMDLSGLENNPESLDPETMDVELYLEGNVVFTQGNNKVFADRMYFDARSRRGIIREAEVFANLPNVEGVVRLRAEEIRIPEEGVFMANDAFVTTSRMGDPLYRFQLNQLVLRSQKRPHTDPRTGQVVEDGPNDVIGRGMSVRVGNVPIFYLPFFAASLDQPSQVINKFSLRNDSIFGWQPILGLDAYRLFGIQNPWKGTDWDLNFSYYSKRGPGMGTEFRYNRTKNGDVIPMGLFTGPGRGNFEFWGIYDTGRDNLGFERRDLVPETKWRFQAIGKHQSTFGNDWKLNAQLGVLSDRNFQEEYFQGSWYEEPDRATTLEFRKEDENRVLSLWGDFRVNDFHTQTQRTPQLDFYWIGQPLMDDLLTWTSYSEVGYVHLYPDTAPEAPADRALWNLLPWEEDRQGVRASTRNEIAYPFQAGVVKIVPYALGEAAYWGEDLNGDSDSRIYGQAGLRASLPMWRQYDVHSELFNVHGVRHKIEFDMEASVSAANKSAYDLPLYDQVDDRALYDFSHHMQATTFGGDPIPTRFDMRSYAIRSNLGGWVTSPSVELADDLALLRFGMHHRWQTKRGIPGRERIVDFVTFDTNFNLYPDSDRDNFGSLIGMLDYDLRWYPGDRVTIFSSGYFDFFTDGLKTVDIGGILDRPGKGSVFASLHYLTGPVENVVLRLGYNYRMSEKWTSTFIAAFDISGEGNIGEAISLTRVGESFLFTVGATYDNPSDNFGVHLSLEPRFGKKGNVARLFNIAPAGTYGVD